jgi:hypothetical protein
MRKAHVAELILSLFTTRERAAATVGDLMEGLPTPGVFWFWSSALRTALSLLWGALKAEPAFMAGLGFRGLMLNLSLWLAFVICLVLCSSIFSVGLGAVSLASNEPAKRLAGGVAEWAIRLAGIGATFTIQLKTGGWLARRAPGREVAACIAFLVIQVIVTSFIGIASGAALQSRGTAMPEQPEPGMWTSILIQFLGYGSLLWGAVRARNRAVRRAQTIRRTM